MRAAGPGPPLPPSDRYGSAPFLMMWPPQHLHILMTECRAMSAVRCERLFWQPLGDAHRVRNSRRRCQPDTIRNLHKIIAGWCLPGDRWWGRWAQHRCSMPRRNIDGDAYVCLDTGYKSKYTHTHAPHPGRRVVYYVAELHSGEVKSYYTHGTAHARICEFI